MGIFKEQIIFLEELQQKQEQIWNDSCDAGILMSNLNKSEVTMLRETIKTLLELPGSEITWKVEKPAIQRQYKLIVMWGAGDYGRMDATCVEVLYYKNQQQEYFSFDSRHVFTDKNGKIQ